MKTFIQTLLHPIASVLRELGQLSLELMVSDRRPPESRRSSTCHPFHADPPLAMGRGASGLIRDEELSPCLWRDEASKLPLPTEGNLMPDFLLLTGLIAIVLTVSALASGLVVRAPLSFPMLFFWIGICAG